jgi:phage terminase large subunit-like protein
MASDRLIRVPRPDGCRFNEQKAQRAVDFINDHCRHTKGEWYGQPFNLRPWQEQDIREVFGREREDGHRQIRTVFKMVPKKTGKQLALDTLIPTPSGWTTMGELAVGDKVFAENGWPCNVTAISEIDETERAFELRFGSGPPIIAGASHQWIAEGPRGRSRQTELYTTLEMFERPETRPSDSDRACFRIQVAWPLRCAEADLPIDPYVYGFWIGNGTATKPELTVFSDDLETIKANIPYEISSEWKQEGRSSVLRVPALKPILVRKWTEKRLPMLYLRASETQRLALLQGLMDSDGCISTSGQAMYSTSVPLLSDDVLELLHSVGIKASANVAESDRYGKPNLPNYRILFTAFDSMEVSRLERKLRNRKPRPTELTRSDYHYVSEVSEVEKRPMRCISVDSPSHQYLAGPWMIPTHNSEEAAAIALKLLFADDEPGAEIYGAAADREQASIIYNVAKSMVEMDPDLRSAAGPRGIVPSTKRILYPEWESYYRVLPGQVKGRHGPSAHGVIFDEIHEQTDMGLWEVLTFGSGSARRQPLFWTCTTAGVRGEAPVAEMLYGEADSILSGRVACPPDFYPVIYSAPDDADWTDEEVWRSVNPALGDFLSIEGVREEYDRARRRPEEQNSFRRLRLNQWVQQTTRWIDMHQWDVCARTFNFHDLKHLNWYAGVDLSTRLDVTALSLCAFDGNGVLYWLPYFWIPRDNILDRPNIEVEKYRVWERKGHLTTTPGNKVDFGAVRLKLNELKRDLKIRQVIIDPRFASGLEEQLEADRFTVVEFTQGFNGYTEPMDCLSGLLADGLVCHGGHPVLSWMADNVEVEQRADGAIRPVKPDRRKSGKRIDGIVAGLMALFGCIRNQQRTSIYDTDRRADGPLVI